MRVRKRNEQEKMYRERTRKSRKNELFRLKREYRKYI